MGKYLKKSLDGYVPNFAIIKLKVLTNQVTH
jgi:hypothetical protein